MKKKMKVCIADDFSPAPEEYWMFQSQNEQVLASYSLAKHCMAVIMPLSALAAVYHPVLALALSLLVGGIGFLLHRKKHGVKGALAPLICSLAGMLIGRFLCAPLLPYTLILKGVYRGI
jgi:Na+-driven multidrug efflux pump